MPNMQNNKTKMAELSPEERIKSFDEVACGYSEEEAINEAERCLHCKNHPCTEGCPVAVQIPEFIELVKAGDFISAYNKIKETNALPAVCGRVCPQEKQCESKCVRGIKGESVGIGRLERFVADYVMEHGASAKPSEEKKKSARVAVIGSGPSGLSCAGALASMGYRVTVFEAFHTPGGVLVYGIPEFRLPKTIVSAEVNALAAMGVEIVTDMVVGRIVSVDELFAEGYSAVFIGTGAGLPSFLGIPGESSCGVYSANEFLTRINLMKAYRDDYDTPIRHPKKAAVIGGGNVAMDAARCARRLGAEVHIIYRRSEEEMPARAEEIHHAKEEGIIFDLLTNPSEILSDENGAVRGMVCDRMQLGEPDADGRRKPVKIEGASYEAGFDTVIVALGTSPNPLIRTTTTGLEADRHGCIVTSDGVTTSKEGVFAGGDAVTGAATVILAMGAGREAAAKIDEYIRNLKNPQKA